MEEILILGVIVGKEQVKMEQKKIKAIKEQKTLTKIKDKKVSGIHKLLPEIYLVLQSYSKTIKQVKRKERMDME